MPTWLEVPGRLYVVATLLPLAGFALLLLAGTVRNLCRPFRQVGGFGSSVYWLLGGDRPLKTGAYFVTGLMAVAAALGVLGLVWFLNDAANAELSAGQRAARWAERTDWVRLASADPNTPAVALELGYRIDHLSALMFAMVTVIGTAIFVFSLGYLADEANETVEDHEVDAQNPGRRPHPRAEDPPEAVGHGDHSSPVAHAPGSDGHDHHGFRRRGRIGRFFLYLSLFAFSMLNLVIADNLFQVFVSWELVGFCSFLLIGFYYERPSAARAANKAFIVNRVGDAGFLVGILVAWTSLGTLNIQELIGLVRSPSGELHAPMAHGLFVVMGLGIFLGCVGKSAQVPLHTWLPDAMEGPTPVSALIHAATMVAAGVYLVGRCFPLFAPEVLLVIAYTGAVTLFVSASIALVQTDIKRVLAYSTCSQLGYMMLALGVGGWVAGLLHLLTHAFFKALLFLCSGSVIHGCHHEQDLRKMGGLYPKMRITAITMLVGVLAIAGTPLLSGWYSKDLIIQSALGYGLEHPEHVALFVLPLVTAAMTGFYVFRLWFLAFTGPPRDEHVNQEAHESPPVMTVPLIFLAVCSVGIAWGWPLWDADASYLGKLLHDGQPAAVEAGFAHALHKAHENHLLAGGLALLAAAAGVGLAVVMYWKPKVDPVAIRAKLGAVYVFLLRKWYFDEAYDAALVRPTVQLAYATAAADKRPTEGPHGEPEPPRREFDPLTLDGWLNAIGQVTGAAGRSLRAAQTGRLRTYVLVLALTAVALLGMLTALAR
jgi:NADH-quinone oxidoreductase subunit L